MYPDPKQQAPTQAVYQHTPDQTPAPKSYKDWIKDNPGILTAAAYNPRLNPNEEYQKYVAHTNSQNAQRTELANSTAQATRTPLGGSTPIASAASDATSLPGSYAHTNDMSVAQSGTIANAFGIPSTMTAGQIADNRIGNVSDVTTTTPQPYGGDYTTGTLPIFDGMLAGKGGFTPEAAANAARQSSNLLNQYMINQQQKGLNALGDQAALEDQMYNQSMNETNLLGAQEYGRIMDQAQQQKAQNISSLTNRGLGNSTILATINNGVDRNTNDALLGVREAQANARIGLNQQQVQNKQAVNAALAQYLLAYTPNEGGAQVAASTVGSPTGGTGAAGSIFGTVAGGLLGSFFGGVGSAAGAAAGKAITS
jgi:hypothetical protein